MTLEAEPGGKQSGTWNQELDYRSVNGYGVESKEKNTRDGKTTPRTLYQAKWKKRKVNSFLVALKNYFQESVAGNWCSKCNRWVIEPLSQPITPMLV